MPSTTPNSRQSIATEMMAHGAPEQVAWLAANSLFVFAHAPGWGLSDLDDRLLAAKARAAIVAHLERATHRAAA